MSHPAGELSITQQQLHSIQEDLQGAKGQLGSVSKELEHKDRELQQAQQLLQDTQGELGLTRSQLELLHRELHSQKRWVAAFQLWAAAGDLRLTAQGGLLGCCPLPVPLGCQGTQAPGRRWKLSARICRQNRGECWGYAVCSCRRCRAAGSDLLAAEQAAC